MGRFKLILCVYFLLGFEESRCDGLPDQVQCKDQESHFQHGYRYEYYYEVETDIGLTPYNTVKSSGGGAGTKLSCDLVFLVPKQCHIILQISNCNFQHRNSSHHFTTVDNSERLAQELSRNDIAFMYNEGEVVNNEIVISNLEPLHIVNMKRGMVSLIQLNVDLDQEYLSNTTVMQHDVLGSCKTDVKFPENKRQEVVTHRDLVTCNLAHVDSKQSEFLSFIKTLKGGYSLSPITERSYPFESSVNCQYSFTTHNMFKTAYCKQKQSYSPLSSDDKGHGVAMATISQYLKLVTRSKLKSQTYDGSVVEDNLTVDLAMEFDTGRVSRTGQDIERELELTISYYLSQGQNDKVKPDSAQNFRKLVYVMRETKEQEIHAIKDSIFECRHSSLCPTDMSHTVEPKMWQSIKERLFMNGLMSCGTDACLIVLAECLRDHQIDETEAQSVLFNIGLFYDPSAKFANIMLDYCKENSKPDCWLSLSAMISRLNDTIERSSRKQEIGKVLYDTTKTLHQMLDSSCQISRLKLSPHENARRSDQLLITLKAINNIGMHVEKVYNRYLEEDKSLDSSLLQCLKNKHHHVTISRAAIKALSIIGIKSTVWYKLFGILNDDQQPLVLRASIFDVLLSPTDEVLLNELLSVLDRTKIENMQSYIVSRIYNILGSLDPKEKKLQEALKRALENRVLPDFDENILSKSHYSEHSINFTVPLTSLEIGGSLALNFIYTPSSNLIQSLTISADWFLDDKLVKLIEIIVDLEGIDGVLELMTKIGENGSHNSFMEAFNSLVKFIKSGAKSEMPNLASFSHKIKETLNHIFQVVNIKKNTFPHVFISYKFKGYEMGTISSNSILNFMHQIKKNNMYGSVNNILAGGTQFLLRAFTLFDYHKLLPTVSGYTLHTDIDSSVLTKMVFNMKTNDHAHEDSASIIKPSASTYFQASMQISIDRYIQSRLAMKTSGFFVVDWSIIYKYSQFLSQKMDWEHSLDILWKVAKQQFTFVKIRSDLYLLHNDYEAKINVPEKEHKYVKCLPEIYATITGRSLCGLWNYHAAPNSDGFPFDILSSFRFEGTLLPDDENLKMYSLQVKWYKRSGHHIVMKLDGSGKDLSRQINIEIKTDDLTGALDLTCQVPDATISYMFGYNHFNNGSHYNYTLASVLRQESKTLNSLIFEKFGYHRIKNGILQFNNTVVFQEIEQTVHLNISLGVLSVDFKVIDSIPVPTNHVKDIVLKYYCEPILRLFYQLHPSPQTAAESDHTSTFLLHLEMSDSQTPLEKTWKAFFKSILLLPDHNITQTTEMIADTRAADRFTNVTWTHRDKQDFYQMYSHVSNVSSPGQMKYNYSLHLVNKEKFDVLLHGQVMESEPKPLKNLLIHCDMIYECLDKRCQKKNTQKLSKIEKPFGGNEQNKITTSESSKLHNKKKVPFWFSPKWSLGIDFEVKKQFYKVGGKIAGLEFQWLGEVKAPRDGDTQLFTNGTVFMGQRKWISGSISDYIYDLNFNWHVDHMITPKVIYHQHNWTLIERRDHTLDRSFNFRLDFEHFQHFKYDVLLKSPKTNFTHHINYTKISEFNHIVRAHALLHSNIPKFDLIYHESSDVNSTDLITKMNMSNTFVNYLILLKKHNDVNGMKILGDVIVEGKSLSLLGNIKLAASVNLKKNQPPKCALTLLYSDNSGFHLQFSVMRPTKVQVEMKAISPHVNLSETSNLLSSTMEVTEGQALTLALHLSDQILQQSHQVEELLLRKLSTNVAYLGQMVAYNIRAEFKDKIIPLINQSFEGLVKTKLQCASRTGMPPLCKIGLGLIDSLNKIWSNLPSVQAIKSSQVDEGLANAAVMLSRMLSQLILHPPYFARQFAKAYVYPTLLTARTTKNITFSAPLYFVSPLFSKSTQGKPNIVMIKKEIQGVMDRRVNKDVGVIMDGYRIKTFDGNVYDIQGPPHTSCTYLLGADFRHGQFGLLYTKDGLSALTRKYGITLARDGSIASIGHEVINHIPYTDSDGQISLTLHDGELHLALGSGLAKVVFNLNHDFYIITLDRILNNASLGLMGTNNKEIGDDFVLYNGSMAEDVISLQNGYELTQNEKCTINSSQTSTICNGSAENICQSLTDLNSSFIPCFMALDPQPFLLQCHTAICQGKSGCSIINAYVTACLYKGIQISLPPSCNCFKKSALDIVFVMSLHHSTFHKQFIPSQLIKNMTHLDLKVGIVTFGGEGEWQNPKSHIWNGKLMETVKVSSHFMRLKVRQGWTQTSADSALLVASQYPFRDGATKVICLLSKQESAPVDNQAILNALQKRSITFVLASAYRELSSNHIVGVAAGGRVIGENHTFTAPVDTYSNIVLATGGMWLDLDTMQHDKKTGIKDVAFEFEQLMNRTEHGCLPSV